MISIIIRTVIVYFSVAVCVRLMGKRQLGQLQPGELVVTIIISEIAASPITSTNEPLIKTLIPLFLLVAFEIFGSLLNRRSVTFRYLRDGRAIVIIKNGTLQQKNMKKLRLTIDDILSALRQKNIFDLHEVEYATVETNGTLSVLQKRKFQPLTNDIMSNPLDTPDIPEPVIIDGRIVINEDNTHILSRKKINEILSREKTKQINVLLMTVDKYKNYRIIKKDDL